MTDVAGVDHKGWLLRQGIDLGDRLFQCPKRVRISWFIEADMAVADLQERQATGFRRLRLAHDAERVRHTARNRPQHTRATPSHAFQHLAPAKAVSMVEFTHCESPEPLVPSRYGYAACTGQIRRKADLFPVRQRIR